MKLRNLLCLLIVLLLANGAFAQQIKVTGTVIDKDGQPLPGVSVKIKGTSTGTSTNFNGQFTISAKMNDILVVSFTGYTAPEYRVTSDKMKITLGINSSPELTDQSYKQIISSKMKELINIPNFAKNTQRKFFSDPTLKQANAAGLEVAGPLTPTAADADGDGLSDADEVRIGTDPHNPDTDGDGLLDGWEVGTINGIDLKRLGASPLHKDIFVQMDYMTRASANNGLGPNPTVIKGIEDAYSSAPVDNPDHIKGINIHLITGKEVPYQPDLTPVLNAFQAIKRQNFDSKRGVAFHYMVWANGYNGGRSSGLSMDIPSSDFIVTLGTWHNNDGGTDDEKIGSFIHELGHNLGLRHGDNDDTNYKPNHFSVMNYAYQVTGIEINGNYQFTYQTFDMPAFDEKHISELTGFKNLPFLHGYQVMCLSNTNDLISTPADAGIDWNDDGQIAEGTIEFDVNHSGASSLIPPTPKEWPRLVFKGGTIGQYEQFAGLVERAASKYRKEIMPELTEDMIRTVRRK